jgi:hypothetical protein
MIDSKRLKARREERGLTLGALGALIAKDAQYVWKLEAGTHAGVHSTTLKDLALALHTSADYLLGLSDVDTPPARATRPAATTKAVSRAPSRSNGHTPAPVPVAADPQPTPRCPRCGTNMQPLEGGARVTCPGCHYTVADET